MHPDGLLTFQQELIAHLFAEIILIADHVRDNGLNVHPNQILQYDRPDEMG